MSTALRPGLIPLTPVLADGFCLDELGPHTIALRSAQRIHIWDGKLYRELGRALENRKPAGRILDELAGEYGTLGAIRALEQLAGHSLIAPLDQTHPASSTVAAPRRLGPADAPYHTYLNFERPPIREFPSPCGYYVFGKGADNAAALTGCLAEAVERSSLYATGEETRVRLSARQALETAVSPRALLPLGESGRDEHPVEWAPVRSLVSGQVRYLPLAFCYFGATGQADGVQSNIVSDSTGCAAGASVNGAAINGFFEVIERDALRHWWLGTSTGSLVQVESFDRGLVDDVRRYLAGRGRNLVLVDITSTARVPAFVALSFAANGRGVLGACAHFDAPQAIEGAVLELGLALNWAETVRVGEFALVPEMGCGPGARAGRERRLTAASYPANRCASPEESLERATSLMRSEGRDLLVLDVSRVGAKYPTVRVTVPGLLRFNPAGIYRMAEYHS